MPCIHPPHLMANGSPAPPPPPAGGGMLMMLLFMILMMFVIMDPDIRSALGGYADPVLSPWLPEESSFILTVLLICSISMFVNTALRNLFMDPIKQAHIAHRQSQVRKMQNEARFGRDPILQEKAMTLQQHMMPEQLEVQMGAMKPMMFTMFFIIAIFAWIGSIVEIYRVDYISLPWTPQWDLLDGRFLFFPAWICAYICMSAPLGRVVDRHIKLVRYRSHPVVLAGESLKEPLIGLVAGGASKQSEEAKRRRQKARQQRRKSRSHGPRKSVNEEDEEAEAPAKSLEGAQCPECDSEMVVRDGPSNLRCRVCLHEWR